MAISGLQRAPTTLHLTTFADLEASEGCRPRGFVIAWGGMGFRTCSRSVRYARRIEKFLEVRAGRRQTV